MTVSTRDTTALGGRFGRWLGAAMIAHFVGICIVKTTTGRPEDILWMSHIGLVIAGVGLLLRSLLPVTTALTCVLALHVLWLLDAISWMTTGVLPLGLATYLPEADAWTWLATVHHFYLAPVLLFVVVRSRRWPEESLLASVAVYLALTVVSRAAIAPAANINYAFGVRTTLEHPLVDIANHLPGTWYLIGLNAFVCAFFLGPAALAGERLARKNRSSKPTAHPRPDKQTPKE